MTTDESDPVPAGVPADAGGPAPELPRAEPGRTATPARQEPDEPVPAEEAEPAERSVLRAQPVPDEPPVPEPAEPELAEHEPAEPELAEHEPAERELAEHEPAEPEPSPLREDVTALRAGVERLTLEVGELARLGKRNADLIDRLHAENQKLRGGELTQAMAPFIRDVIRMHDDVVRLDEAAPGTGDLALVRQQVLGVLSRAGVEMFGVAAGEAFDASRHHGVGVVEAPDGDANGTVASVLRCGFSWSDGRVLRPAEVRVHRSRPPAAASPQQPQGDD